VYTFRHPLIRTVAYESQLKSVRAQSHRRLAGAIEARGPADENAALIAEHLEAAGDLREAFNWHMRAGSWSAFRDMAAAHTSWRRARQVADRLPHDDRDSLNMRIAPAPCCVRPRIEWAAVAPTPASRSCVSCAPPRLIDNRSRLGWRA